MGRGAPPPYGMPPMGHPPPYPPMMPYGMPPYGMPPMMQGMYRPQMPMQRPGPPPAKPAPASAPVISKGPTLAISVFVGKLPPDLTDDFLKRILEQCGPVSKWSRISKTFGFCEYLQPEAASRALRILKDLKIKDKVLLIKVDDKAKKKLQEYQDSLVKPVEKNAKDVESYEKDVKEQEKKKDDAAMLVIEKLIESLDEDTKDESKDEKSDNVTTVEEMLKRERAKTEGGDDSKKEDDSVDKDKSDRRDRDRERRDRDRDRDRDRRRDRDRDRDRDRRRRRDDGDDDDRRRRENRRREREERERERESRLRRDKERIESRRRKRRERGYDEDDDEPKRSRRDQEDGEISDSSNSPPPPPPPPPASETSPAPPPPPPAQPQPAPAETKEPEPVKEKKMSFKKPRTLGKKRKSAQVQTANIFGMEETEKKMELIPLDDDQPPPPPPMFSEDGEKAETTAPKPGDKSNKAMDAEKTTSKWAPKPAAAVDEIPKIYRSQIDWAFIKMLDLLENNIRPWVRKRVKKFLGEEEKDLINFVMAQLNARKRPESIEQEMEIAFGKKEARKFTTDLWKELFSYSKSAAKYK